MPCHKICEINWALAPEGNTGPLNWNIQGHIDISLLKQEEKFIPAGALSEPQANGRSEGYGFSAMQNRHPD